MLIPPVLCNHVRDEVNQDFARTMNKIIMEKTLEKSEEELKDMIPANLQLPENAPPKETSYHTLEWFQSHSTISQNNSQTSALSLCTLRKKLSEPWLKSELIATFCSRRIESSTSKALRQTMRVEEFKQIQSSSIAQISHNTGEQGWIGRLAKIIKASFDDVGKGWFNIHETSKETYEFGKLKKFLTLVNFMMQDAVLTLA